MMITNFLFYKYNKNALFDQLGISRNYQELPKNHYFQKLFGRSQHMVYYAYLPRWKLRVEFVPASEAIWKSEPALPDTSLPQKLRKKLFTGKFRINQLLILCF
jgi:hypothetical protein